MQRTLIVSVQTTLEQGALPLALPGVFFARS
ncbi:hypothetical protein FIU91_01420 [Roseivivax sp. THAF30]|nr:hypothetical protein FIU91_01420 [Roseivivax sp. THAF30]